MKIPHTTTPAWEPAAPGRFAASVRTDRPDGCLVALVGLADDLGVKLNGGRVGAIQGPSAFRRALARLGAAEPDGLTWPGVFDAGDVAPAASLEETHLRVTQAVEAILKLGLLPVGIGGGHDLTFPFVRAVAKRFRPLAGVYFDAHTDVRETAGSGMAFRRLLEDGDVAELHLHGFRPWVNSAAHAAWLRGHGGRIHEDGRPVGLPAGPRHLFVSFDLDVLDMSQAPGVSAPNPCGWSVREAQPWVERAGAEPRVRAFDLMELCPPHDEGGRTARVAAHLFLAFLSGVARR